MVMHPQVLKFNSAKLVLLTSMKMILITAARIRSSTRPMVKGLMTNKIRSTINISELKAF